MTVKLTGVMPMLSQTLLGFFGACAPLIGGWVRCTSGRVLAADVGLSGVGPSSVG